jgi:hypothetical protein
MKTSCKRLKPVVDDYAAHFSSRQLDFVSSRYKPGLKMSQLMDTAAF